MREEEKAFAGLLFDPGDPELVAMKAKAHRLSQDYNQSYEEDVQLRQELLQELMGFLGENGYLQGPIFFHYGKHTHIGRDFFAGFHFTVQDDGEVFIGDRCSFGPNVTIVTPFHPMLGKERSAIRTGEGEEKYLCYAKPVHVGNDCWFGACVTVCSGVSIGDNCVIGAGSVVTRDIPPNSFAAGVPCRVIRTLTEADSLRHHPEILGDCQIIEE